MSPRMIRARLRGMGRDKDAARDPGSEPDQVMEIDPAELAGIFRAPNWLRDLGIGAWLLIGILLFLFGMVWLLSLTIIIVLPVLTAGIIASVALPVVDWLARHRVPRGLGTALVLLAVVLAGLLMVYLVVAGIADQRESLGSELSKAADKIESAAKDVGIGDAAA